MAGERTVKVKFLGDTKDLDGAIEKSSGALGKFGSTIGDIGKAAAGFAIGEGVTKLPGFFMDAAKAAAEDEQSTARLQATIWSLGGDFDAQVAAVNDAIAAGQKLGFSDDETRDSFDKLAQATGSTEEALKRNKAAMDLARGANIPLSDASKLLGKVTDENLQVFKRLGITLPDVASEADVLAAVQGKFAGQSDAYAKSTAGQFAILQDRIGEAKETIGYALLPVMAKLAGILADDVVPAIERFATFFQQNLAPAIGDIAGVIKDKVLPPLQQLADWFLGNKDAMIAAGVAIGTVLVIAFTAWAISAGAAAVATIAAAAPVLALVAVIAALAAGVVLLIRHWDDITAKFPILGTIVDGIKAGIEGFIGWITGTFVPAVAAIGTAVVEGVGAAIGFVKDHWGEIMDVIGPVMDAAASYIGEVWNAIQTVIDTALGVIKGLIDVFIGVFTGDWGRAWDGIKEIVSSVWEGIEGIFTGTVMPFFTSTLPSLLEGAMALVGAPFKALWSNYIGPAVQTVIDGIEGFVNGFIGAVNWVITKFGIPAIPTWGGIALPGVGGGGANYDFNSGASGYAPGAPGLATGTDNWRGGWAWVGERGPELVKLPAGAKVIPNDTSMGLAKAGAGLPGFFPGLGDIGDAIGDFLGDTFGSFGDWVGSAWDTMSDAGKAFVQRIGQAGLQVLSSIPGIKDLAQLITNGPIWLLKKALDILGVGIPSINLAGVSLGPAIFGKAFDAAGDWIWDHVWPFADGGVVTKPTLGLVGENGPEAIIPLRGGKGGLATSVTVHINGDVYATSEAQARRAASWMGYGVAASLRSRGIA